MSTVVSHYNTDWTLSGTPTVTEFCDGSKCVSPCNLESVTPNNNGTWNLAYTGSLADQGPNSGSMIVTVGGGNQAFVTDLKYSVGLEASGPYYSTAVDVSRSENLPVALADGAMLVSCSGQTNNGSSIQSYLNEVVALAVLATPPPAGSFRPGMFSTTPRTVLHNEADLDYSVLPNLPPVPYTPPIEYINSRCSLGLPELSWVGGEPGTKFVGANNASTNGSGIIYPNPDSTYGREWAFAMGVIALGLCTRWHADDATNNALKRQMVVSTVQRGLDIYSFLKTGGIYYPDGGHSIGRLFPVVLAAVMLDDAEMKAFLLANPNVFAETRTTWYITVDDVGRTVANMDYTYISGDVTVPPKAEWGIKHMDSPMSDSRDLFSPPYRNVTYPALSNSNLAMHLMGVKSVAAWPALFDYDTRFIEEIQPIVAPAGPNLGAQMRAAYYDSASVTTPIHAVALAGTPRDTYSVDSARAVTLTGLGFYDEIRYTTDGEDVDESSTLYSGPFTPTFVAGGTVTVKWRAFRSDADPSVQGEITLGFTSDGLPAEPVNLTFSVN